MWTPGLLATDIHIHIQIFGEIIIINNKIKSITSQYTSTTTALYVYDLLLLFPQQSQYEYLNMWLTTLGWMWGLL